MTVSYTVAAERASELRGSSIRNAARGSERVPAGTSHAVAPDSRTTACGLTVAGLELFPETVFVDASFLARCHDCERVVRRA